MIAFVQFRHKSHIYRYQLKDIILRRFVDLKIKNGDRLYLKNLGRLGVRGVLVRGNMLIIDCKVLALFSEFKPLAR